MQDFDFKRCTRKCDASGREIAPGEKYFSAVVDTDENISRLDFSEESWEGPPENCLGWWQSRIPVLEKGKIYWAPNRVLIAYFESITTKPDHKGHAYVMTLLLIRKRILQWKDTITRDGTEMMQVRSTGTKTNYEIEVMEVAQPEIQAIQNELAEQLFTDIIENETVDEIDDTEADS